MTADDEDDDGLYGVELPVDEEVASVETGEGGFEILLRPCVGFVCAVEENQLGSLRFRCEGLTLVQPRRCERLEMLLRHVLDAATQLSKKQSEPGRIGPIETSFSRRLKELLHLRSKSWAVDRSVKPVRPFESVVCDAFELVVWREDFGERGGSRELVKGMDGRCVGGQRED